jgi:hypothetical protein
MTKHGATRVASECTEESAVAVASAEAADAADVAVAGPSGPFPDRLVLARLVPGSGLGSAGLAG